MKKNWPSLLGRTFFKRFYTQDYNIKRIFYSDKICSITDSLHFWGLRPLCSSRLRLQEKSLVDHLPLNQNLLKTVLSWTTFLNWRPLAMMNALSDYDDKKAKKEKKGIELSTRLLMIDYMWNYYTFSEGNCHCNAWLSLRVLTWP